MFTNIYELTTAKTGHTNWIVCQKKVCEIESKWHTFIKHRNQHKQYKIMRMDIYCQVHWQVQVSWYFYGQVIFGWQISSMWTIIRLRKQTFISKNIQASQTPGVTMSLPRGFNLPTCLEFAKSTNPVKGFAQLGACYLDVWDWLLSDQCLTVDLWFVMKMNEPQWFLRLRLMWSQLNASITNGTFSPPTAPTVRIMLIPDFDTICRLCLAKGGNMVSIFGGNGKSQPPLNERIQHCTYIKVRVT